MTATVIADYVPAGDLPKPKPPALAICEMCHHPISGFAHVNIAGYGDPQKHCHDCQECDRLRAQWQAERRAGRRMRGMT